MFESLAGRVGRPRASLRVDFEVDDAARHLAHDGDALPTYGGKLCDDLDCGSCNGEIFRLSMRGCIETTLSQFDTETSALLGSTAIPNPLDETIPQEWECMEDFLASGAADEERMARSKVCGMKDCGALMMPSVSAESLDFFGCQNRPGSLPQRDMCIYAVCDAGTGSRASRFYNGGEGGMSCGCFSDDFLDPQDPPGGVPIQGEIFQ